MANSLRSAFQFFFSHAGYCVGSRAAGALNLARAEAWAEDNGYTFVWESDDDPELGDHAYWCAAARRDKAGYDIDGEPIPSYSRSRECDGHEALVCVMRDADGAVVQSLCGILDPDRAYGRVIEAELALEEMPDTAMHTSAFSYMGGDV
jgi:hypothetical protein